MPYLRSKHEQLFRVSPPQTFSSPAPSWHGWRAEIVADLQPPPFEYLFKFPHAVLTTGNGQGIVARDGLPDLARHDLGILPLERTGLDRAPTHHRTLSRGGLSGWQRNKVANFIEDHVGEALRLSALADLVGLSPYHFARAFKQSFGLPPHRYHLSRRIERAKTMLAEPQLSVTEIALTLGFAETSSFSATFRRIAGASPRDWRRTFR